MNTGTESSPSYQLVIASDESGEEGRISDIVSSVGQTGAGGDTALQIAYSAPDVNGDATSANNITVGNDAIAVIDGLTVRRSTNSFSDVLVGITIDVRALTESGEATITVDPDREAVRSQIDLFVNAYNEVVDFINGQNTFTPGSGDESGTTGGLLFGDSLLSNVKRSIRSALFNVDPSVVANDPEGYSTLSLVGIEQDSEEASVDSTTFDEKFTENLPLLMDLFADTDGFDNGGADENTPGYYEDTTADGGLMNQLARHRPDVRRARHQRRRHRPGHLRRPRGRDRGRDRALRRPDHAPRGSPRILRADPDPALRAPRGAHGRRERPGRRPREQPRRPSRSRNTRLAQPGTSKHPTRPFECRPTPTPPRPTSQAPSRARPSIKIVRMLYQGALRFIMQAEGEDAAAPSSSFVQFCSDADAIVAELRLALDAGHGSADVVDNLTQLYLFCEGEPSAR